jgi:hypothetical protein
MRRTDLTSTLNTFFIKDLTILFLIFFVQKESGKKFQVLYADKCLDSPASLWLVVLWLARISGVNAMETKIYHRSIQWDNGELIKIDVLRHTALTTN